MADVTITDDNWTDFIAPVVAGERKMMGLVPRDFATHPHGCLAYARPFDLPLIPESEWADRLAIQKATRSRLIDLRMTANAGQPIPSRDQDGYGYCWAHSSTSAALMVRAAMGEPYADLSAFAVACIIKNYRNQGGWGAESLEFIAERGIPTADHWPQKSTSRANDNPQTWDNAKQHRFTDWMDLDPQQMRAQLVTCLLLNIPVVSDFGWWEHSVCSVALESIDPFITWIWNSWTDDWGTLGMGKLQGGRAIPDSAVAPKVMTASTV